MQKLYILRPSIGVAFAGNIDEVKRALKKVRRTLRKYPHGGSWNAQRANTFKQSVIRCFSRIRNKAQSRFELLVAIGFSGHEYCNALYQFDYFFSDKEHHYFGYKEIQNGGYYVGGSCHKEPDFDQFEQSVIKQVVFPNPNCEMVQRVALLHAQYTTFHQKLASPWQTVGQMMHAISMNDGVFSHSETGTIHIDVSGVKVNVALEFDQTSRRYYQVNIQTGQAVWLIEIDSYGRQSPPPYNITFKL